jgi:(p)ppGpp synthase/HD superfamily hydrolase
LATLTLDKAIEFAVQSHMGQRDRGGNSYIRHPLRVMEKMESEDEMVVAILHDVLEDTQATVADLVHLGCTEAQIKAIDALTKKEGQAPEEYLRLVKLSTVARKVKIADIEDNMILWRMKNRHALGEKDLQRINKYMQMWSELKGI